MLYLWHVNMLIIWRSRVASELLARIDSQPDYRYHLFIDYCVNLRINLAWFGLGFMFCTVLSGWNQSDGREHSPLNSTFVILHICVISFWNRGSFFQTCCELLFAPRLLLLINKSKDYRLVTGGTWWEC